MGFQTFFDQTCAALENSAVVTALSTQQKKQTRFKNQFSFEHRLKEATRQLAKYPDRIPIIVEDDSREQIPCRTSDTKRKFLVPRSFTFGEFIYMIRKRARMQPHQALFLFVEKQDVNGKVSMLLPPTGASMGSLYEQYQDSDAFVYVTVTTESVFG